MDRIEILKKIESGNIVRVEAEDWDDERKWLSSMGTVKIILDNGIILDTLGEPLGVNLMESNVK